LLLDDFLLDYNHDTDTNAVIVTVLASVFLLLLVGIVFYGYGFLMRQGRLTPTSEMGRCLLCGTIAPKDQLVPRTLHGGKEVLLCSTCIVSLHTDLLRTQTVTKPSTKDSIG